MARILVPGKIVATNGAYEDECRIGLEQALTLLLQGFPKNHLDICAVILREARRKFSVLPRVLKIIKEKWPWPGQRCPFTR